MAKSSPADRPIVSIVVPMWNEVVGIRECIDGFSAQSYPPEHFEVLVVDGRSDDGSRELVESLSETHPWLRLIDNPARRIPVACNLGIENANGDIVCFFSSHGVPAPTFIERVVDVLMETGADGVGGRYLHEGTSPASTAIGLAMASRFGMASPHRFATTRTEVDTISHPAYRIETVRAVGGFDEDMQRNEDYALNWLIRQRGGRLVFDPSIESIYRPRGSLSALARQFFWYGTYKSRMLRQHPRSTKARHLIPPLMVAFTAATPLLISNHRLRKPTLALWALYSAGVTTALVDAKREAPDANTMVLAAAFPAMHFAWGSGFLAGFTRIEAL